MAKERTISEIKEFLTDLQERAKRELDDIKKIGAHSSYGAGVEWGEMTATQKTMDFLNFEEEV